MDDMSDLSELFPDMPQDGIDHALSFDDLTGAASNWGAGLSHVRKQGERGTGP